MSSGRCEPRYGPARVRPGAAIDMRPWDALESAAFPASGSSAGRKIMPAQAGESAIERRRLVSSLLLLGCAMATMHAVFGCASDSAARVSSAEFSSTAASGSAWPRPRTSSHFEHFDLDHRCLGRRIVGQPWCRFPTTSSPNYRRDAGATSCCIIRPQTRATWPRSMRSIEAGRTAPATPGWASDTTS